MKGFASDNNSGVHSEVLDEIIKSNIEHEKGYGDDRYTEQAISSFKQLLGEDIEVYFTMTGTGSNTLAIAAVCSSYHSVLCADTAHINVDECGSPEKLTGCKLVSIPTLDGKLTPDLIRPYLHGFGVCHHSQPGLISITQVTELGTIYTPEEIRAIADLAHNSGLYLHVDGARISNAVASLNIPISELITDSGVDILSFGGTKNGMLMGEAVVIINQEHRTTKRLIEDSSAATAPIEYYRKQNAQLFSKMRYVGAQFKAYFRDDLWLNSASHANKMAALLASRVAEIPEVKITQKVQANGVFAIVPAAVIPILQKKFFFYVWDYNLNEVRWMTSFDTTEDEIKLFADELQKCCTNLRKCNEIS